MYLYRLRWEVGKFFREFTSTLKAQQWHSEFVNGIMQEIYALLWLINFTKILMQFSGKKPLNPMSRRYEKPNFKLILNFIVKIMPKIWKRIADVIRHIQRLIKDSTERRKRYSRSYPREIKSPASPYPYNNTGWVWEFGKAP